jgi:hypothetical protein
VVRTCNSSIWEAEAGSYAVRHSLKIKHTQNQGLGVQLGGRALAYHVQGPGVQSLNLLGSLNLLVPPEPSARPFSVMGFLKMGPLKLFARAGFKSQSS